MSVDSAKVSICVVTHESAAELPGFLEAVGRLSYRPLELVLIDCASQDDSLDIAKRLAPAELAVQLIDLDSNLGFAGGMNRAIEAANGDFILSLNPDTRPAEDFVHRLTELATTPGRRIGAVTGRLTRLEPSAAPSTLDACGMFLTPTWRHLDRGSGQLDHGQWLTAERVFGATGAATLFSRSALADVALAGQAFDPDFHSYREDAELCFRLQERRWEVLYAPRARCFHRRANLPSRRREMSPGINHHSLKNRYLLRAYHQDTANLVITLLPSLFRDLLALGYVLLRERRSLSAYSWLWRHRDAIRARRREIRARRTCSWWQLNRWFVLRRLPL
jgi:GT2 family glycosyltransferase